MLIDCGLTKKDLDNSRLYCSDWDNETCEEWFERLKQLGFGAGLDRGEEKPHIYYFRWRRKAIYEQKRVLGLTFKSIGESHGISKSRVGQVYAQAQKQFG
jgi:hypothetical protein